MSKKLLNVYNRVVATRLLLDSRKNWTKGANGRAKNGASIYSASPYAVKWCMGGAYSACDDASTESFRMFENNFMEANGLKSGIVSFNDAYKTNHGMILKALDNTIGLLETKLAK